MRRSPSSCDCTEIRTHVPTSEGFEVTNWTTGAWMWEKRGAHELVHLVKPEKAAPVTRTTLRITGPVPIDSRQ